jgi:hypothetical protein
MPPESPRFSHQRELGELILRVSAAQVTYCTDFGALALS